MKTKLTTFFISLAISAFSQNVAINVTGHIASPSAILDLSTGNRGTGFLPPQDSLLSTTDVATIPSPATGLFVYNKNASMIGGGLGYYYWNGAAWAGLSGSGSGWSITGNAGTTAGTNFIGTTDAKGFVTRLGGKWSGIMNYGTTSNTTNLFYGVYAGDSTTSTGVQDLGIGFQALGKLTTGYYNTAVGPAGPLAFLTTGFGNTALGDNAGNTITTGAGNTPIGNFTLNNTTTGSYNTAVGYNSGRGITIETGNTLVGAQTMGGITGYNNSIVGYQGMLKPGGGYSSYGNTGIGYQVLYSSNTSHCVAIGDSAEVGVTGTGSTAIGYQANTGSYSNATAIGSGAIAYNNNSITSGNASVTRQYLNGSVVLVNGTIYRLDTSAPYHYWYSVFNAGVETWIDTGSTTLP